MREVEFAYDGINAIADCDGANALLRRHVFANGVDDPIVWYEGAGTSDRRFLSADERGSIVSLTDTSGALIGINRYDEYGKPQTTNLGAFQYTGQRWLSDLGAYYYKARIYLPRLGMFPQTDPAGYDPSPNLYAYVGKDPVNGRDPSGLVMTSGADSISCSTESVFDELVGFSCDAGSGGSGGGVGGGGDGGGGDSGSYFDSVSFLYPELTPQNDALGWPAAYDGGPIDWQNDPSSPYYMTPQFQSIMTPDKEYDIAFKIIDISAGIEPVREQLLASDIDLPGGWRTLYNIYSMGPSFSPGPERIANHPGSVSYFYSPYHYRPGPGVPNVWIEIRYSGQ